MKQEITITKEIINYFEDNLPGYLEETNAQKIIKLLKENYFLVDKNRLHFKQIWDASKCIKDERLKSEIQRFIEWGFREKFCAVDTDFDSPEFLSLHSNDKLLFEPFLTNKKINKQRIKYSPVEFYNAEKFVFPEITDRLKHGNSVLTFEANVSYNIGEILKPYIRKSSVLVIEDPFLPNPNARHNLDIILDHFDGSEITIKTYSEIIYKKYVRNNQQNYKKFIKYINNINIGHKLIEYKDRGHKERYIKTDLLELTLPGGLDFINTSGYLTRPESYSKIHVYYR